ncbi:MAG: aldolase/citrate lyase family protein [Planctomycetaceae bacterium]
MTSVRPNPVKETLDAGGTIFSSSVRLTDPGLCEILGHAGFDFVLLDGEHGAMDPSSIDRLVQGCFAGETVPIVRVLRNNDAEAVMHALDLGVQGVLIPHCRTVEDARALRTAALYSPEGNRGFGPARGMKWGRVASADYFRDINDTVALLALVEDIEGVENIESIAAAGLLDVLWVGTGDLAMAYGHPGERDHPEVKAAADRILTACLEYNVAAGFPARSPEEAAWAVEQGYRAIGYAGAETYVMKQSRLFLDAVGR